MLSPRFNTVVCTTAFTVDSHNYAFHGGYAVIKKGLHVVHGDVDTLLKPEDDEQLF